MGRGTVSKADRIASCEVVMQVASLPEVYQRLSQEARDDIAVVQALHCVLTADPFGGAL